MRILFWLTTLLSVALVAPLHAAPTPLEGTWSGTGTMQQMDGPPQKLRCRIDYTRETDKVYRLAAKCVTVSSTINQTGQLLKVNPGVYVGEFYVASYDVSGRIRVVIEDTVQTMTFKSSQAQGSVTLTKS
jgi:hypothetical protein